jgi:site-specific recombinase XerD
MNAPALGQLLHGYFEDYLKCQRGLRVTSIRSYRDAITLFLRLVAKLKGTKISRLQLEDLTCERVLAFLSYLESERGNHVRTRNHRLAILRTFFEYIVHQTPEGFAEAQRITAIPSKRVPPAEMRFMDSAEVKTLFASLPKTGNLAPRDRTLLLFLYNTGARAQEVSDLRWKNIELDAMPKVHLHGKGDKWRTCPLWKETVEALNGLLDGHDVRDPEGPVFTSRHNLSLTRFGIYKAVRRHTRLLDKPQNGRPQRNVSPHCFRHTAAVHLLEAGVDPNVIRGWLGHVGLETTNRYAEITLRMKEKALAMCEPPVLEAPSHRTAIWRDDAELLKWLKSL